MQHQPHRLAHGRGEMRDASVDRDDEIEGRDQEELDEGHRVKEEAG